MPQVPDSEITPSSRSAYVTTDDLNDYATDDELSAAIVGGVTPAIETAIDALKANLSINVKDYDAAGDGTTDDTAAIQAALDVAIAAGGGIVWFPEGTYLCHGLVIAGNNVHLQGEGRGHSILKQPTGTSDNTYLISVQGTGTTTADNRSEISVRDLQLLGRSDTDSFTQYVHLLALSGVSDVLVEGCLFKHWRGDAIYLGSGLTSQVERHNENVVIKRCKFDGGTARNNRNGVSIIDGTAVWIKHCKFYSCTDDDMPGPIDMEPNNNAYHRVRGIWITDNEFDSCGGNVGQITYDITPTQATLTTDTQGIIIRGNKMRNIEGTIAGIFCRHKQTPTATTPPNDIVIRENEVLDASTVDAILLEGVRGVTIKDNYLAISANKDCIEMGWAYGVREIDVLDNHLHRTGTTDDETGIAMATAATINIRRNNFDNIGRLTSMLNNGGASVSSGISLFDNWVTGAVAWSVCSKDGSHTTTAASNSAGGNRFNDIDITVATFAGADSRPGYRTAPKSLASAATLTLTNDSDYFTITGTTTVTAVSGGWSGRRVTLRFEGILTFTDGGALRLANNFTTSDADTISMIHDGTNWHETSRSVN